MFDSDFDLPPHCPSCRSTDLRHLNPELATGRGCGAALMRHAASGLFVRIASVFTGKRFAGRRPRR